MATPRHFKVADFGDEPDDTGLFCLATVEWSEPKAFPATAVLVRSDAAMAQSRPSLAPANPGSGTSMPPGQHGEVSGQDAINDSGVAGTGKPRRFYGTVDLDMVRPVKAFDAVLNAVVLELQRTPGAKVKITVEIEAENEAGFDEADIGVVRDNARHLKFRADSTGFE